jgi:hypothetical protein
MDAANKLTVIVDPAFGERLADRPADEPVWIVESEVNTPVVKRLWKTRSPSSHLTGITLFQAAAGLSAEEELIAHLDDIDLHHGEYSADPPYSVLEVIGCHPSDKVVIALGEFGFRITSATQAGFVACRQNGWVAV